MMKLLKKNLTLILAGLGLIFIFFVTRFYNLLSLPIFTDEAIYIRWAQIARFDSNWRFISLTDGKNPTFVWIQMIVMKLIDDPLLAGRLVSVFSGFLVVIGVSFLTYELFKKLEFKKAILLSILSGGIAVLFPFLLVYDRLAIYESLTAAFFVWTLYFQVLLVRYLRLDIAMVLGFVLGGALLTKSSAFLSIYLSPIFLLILNLKKNGLKTRLGKYLLFTLIAVVIAYLMYSIQRLSPFFNMIEEKNSVFVYPVSEWLKFRHIDKVGNFISNFRGLFDWFVVYVTVPYILLALFSFAKKELTKEKILLAAWFLFPFLGLCVFGKTLYPRYLLFMVIPLIPLIAYGFLNLFQRFKSNIIRFSIVLIALFLPLRIDYYILTDIARAPIPRLDLEQYVNGWPAGGGVSQSVEFFKKEAEKGPIYVATQGTFGLMPASYEIFLYNDKRITIKGYWPINEEIPEEVLKEASVKPTYFVFYQDCQLCDFPGDAPDSWPLEKVISYDKGVGTTKLTVYRVLPQSE